MLLAIDTATDHASLALHDGIQVQAELTWESARRHTVELAPRVRRALKQLNLNVADLSGVAVAQGPGSFTGLRVGMAMAKGLALSQAIPIVGVPTLDIIASAQGKQGHKPLCAMLQAGRERICVAYYRWKRSQWQVSEEPRLATWDTLVEQTETPTLFCGEINQKGLAALSTLEDLAIIPPPAARLRRAGYLAEIAWQRLRVEDVDNALTLAPIYLQHPV